MVFMPSALENFKKAWKELEVEEERNAFKVHLASYIIVNSFLIFVNLYSSSNKLWFPWILFGWGIGLAFHYLGSREEAVINGVENRIAMIEHRMKKNKK